MCIKLIFIKKQNNIMKYLRKYQKNEEFEADYNSSSYLEPWVSFTKENDKVDYNKPEAYGGQGGV